MNSQRKGITSKEILVIVAVLAVLLVVLIAFLRSRGGGDDMLQTLTNMRQLQIATQIVTVDNQALEKPIRWTCANGQPITYSQWTNMLTGANLSASDIHKLLTARTPRAFWSDKITEDPFTVFAVSDGDPKNTLLLVTKNWHGLDDKKISGEPYGNKGFIVMHKEGNGEILRPTQSQNASIVGDGGSFHYLPLK